MRKEQEKRKNISSCKNKKDRETGSSADKKNRNKNKSFITNSVTLVDKLK